MLRILRVPTYNTKQMEDKVRDVIEYKFEIGEIMNKCLRQLKFISETMSALYHAIVNYKEHPIQNLQTDTTKAQIQKGIKNPL